MPGNEYPYRKRRPRGPGIPVPSRDNFIDSILALKEVVETLMGWRKGSAPDSAVTWQDLVDLGLIEQEQIPPDIEINKRNRFF